MDAQRQDAALKNDRMGEYNNLWEGADLHSDTTLPTNIQHVLAPANDPNNPTPSSNQPNDQPIEPIDPIDALVDKLDEYDETFADTLTASIPQDDSSAKNQAAPPMPNAPDKRNEMYAEHLFGSTRMTKHNSDATLKQNNESEWGDWNDRLSNPITMAKQAGTSATADWSGDTLNKGDDKDLRYLGADQRHGKGREQANTRPTIALGHARVTAAITPITRSNDSTPRTSPRTNNTSRQAAAPDHDVTLQVPCDDNAPTVGHDRTMPLRYSETPETCPLPTRGTPTTAKNRPGPAKNRTNTIPVGSIELHQGCAMERPNEREKLSTSTPSTTANEPTALQQTSQQSAASSTGRVQSKQTRDNRPGKQMPDHQSHPREGRTIPTKEELAAMNDAPLLALHDKLRSQTQLLHVDKTGK